MCGISVVKDWEKLKRFNLEQIQQSGIEEKVKVIVGSNVTKGLAQKPDHTGAQKGTMLDATKAETEDQQEDPGEPVLLLAHGTGMDASEENLAADTENAT